MSETETTISKLVAFASDPDVKAIVMCQAVPGATPGIQKIREMGRDDILFIAGTPQEDPAVISDAADIIMYANEAGQGDTIMEKCAEWGIDVFMHYSFPRHMAMETIVGRYNILKANAEALGIEFVDVTAPDPTGEAGHLRRPAVRPGGRAPAGCQVSRQEGCLLHHQLLHAARHAGRRAGY